MGESCNFFHASFKLYLEEEPFICPDGSLSPINHLPKRQFPAIAQKDGDTSRLQGLQKPERQRSKVKRGGGGRFGLLWVDLVDSIHLNKLNFFVLNQIDTVLQNIEAIDN